MSESDSDPERLLAEALRAQARSAPPPPRTREAAKPQPVRPVAAGQADEGLPHGYGLLSGTGASSLERERAALDDLPAPAGGNEPVTVEQHLPAGEAREPAPLAAHWILLLAVLLGLAAGSVVGLLTLL